MNDSSSLYGILGAMPEEITELLAHSELLDRTEWRGLVFYRIRMEGKFYCLVMNDEYHWTDSLTSIVNAEATLKEVTRFNEGGPPINALDLSDKQRYYSSYSAAH